MLQQTITINTDLSYPLYCGESLYDTDEFITLCRKENAPIVLMFDENVEQHAAYYYQALISANLVHQIVIKSGEAQKTRETKALLEDKLLALGLSRNVLIIAMGGGMVLDLVGFVAATYCRGIPVIYIPTTLLAMIDASIGGKVAVNTPHAKNSIGVFKQPQAVFIDLNTLSTLPEAEYRYAFSEIIKAALIADPILFDLLWNNAEALLRRDNVLLNAVLLRAIQVKKDIVERDPFEKSERALLNLGHTVAHAIEKINQYQITHGKAVAYGLWVEAAIAKQLQILSSITLEKIVALLQRFELLTGLLPWQQSDDEAMLTAMQLDKKNRNDAIHFVLLQDIGKPHLRSSESDALRYSHPVAIEVIVKVFEIVTAQRLA